MFEDSRGVANTFGTERAKPSKLAQVQVVLASILMVGTLPGRTQGLGLVTEPFLADFRLDRVTFASMNLWATILGALLCFPAGWAIERVGLRWSTTTVVLMLGLFTWQLSAWRAALRLFFYCCSPLGGLVRARSPVCSIVTVGRWFPNRAGFAMGVYLRALESVVRGGVWGHWLFGSTKRMAHRLVANRSSALLCFVLPLAVLTLREPRSIRRLSDQATENESAGERDQTGSPRLHPSAGAGYRRVLAFRWVGCCLQSGVVRARPV